MKFYVTIENLDKLKKCFLNLKLFSIIYIPTILDEYGYTSDTMDEYSAFIVNEHINNIIISQSKSKRIRGIIYSHPNINDSLISNLFETLSKMPNIREVVLLDDYNVPKLTNLYKLFDEIVFFPSIKKIRLIECVKISDLQKIQS